MESSTFLEHSCSTEIYSMFTFEALYKLVIEFSKLVKYCVLQYISSSTIFTKPTSGVASRVYSVP